MTTLIRICLFTSLLLVSCSTVGAVHPELKAFPEAKSGMERFVISLPHKERAEEAEFKVELIPGKTMTTDGVNRMLLRNHRQRCCHGHADGRSRRDADGGDLCRGDPAADPLQQPAADRRLRSGRA